jgi:ABC-2 type transport system ATP-binding protein
MTIPSEVARRECICNRISRSSAALPSSVPTWTIEPGEPWDAPSILLDEPTLGLDAIARRQLFVELLKFMTGEGRTILISSHQLTDLERFADHAAIVNRGKLLTSGRMDELVERYRQYDARVLSDISLGLPGVSVIDRQGDRVRLLVDGEAAPTAAVAGGRT